jgi:hypothetical protein
MIIANPLYDVVFKYLMEDMGIAREILSTILAEEIHELEANPQERFVKILSSENTRILHFNFKATIKSPTGKTNTVLIKLNVSRYKRYDLGENYNSKQDKLIRADGTQITESFDVVTIYILGFEWNQLNHAIIKAKNEDGYQDVLTGKIIEQGEENFAKLLTPNSYLIQAHHLPLEVKTKLERILHFFNLKFRTRDEHKIDFAETIDEPIVQKIRYRLLSALVDDTIRRSMNVEDEIESMIKWQMNGIAATLAVQKRLFEEEVNNKTIETDKQKLTDIDQAKERKVRSLINYSNLSDTEIASATTSTLYFVQKLRYDLMAD